MSYDLLVFRTEAAPRDPDAFLDWCNEQTKWTEGHSYDDPAVTSPELRSWFLEMIETFPAMNGPYAIGEEKTDEDNVTDYSIGKDIIYAGFGWDQTEEATEMVWNLALKYEVGYYDLSGNKNGIVFPDELELAGKLDLSRKKWWQKLFGR
jgi:hypothetical protein